MVVAPELPTGGAPPHPQGADRTPAEPLYPWGRVYPAEPRPRIGERGPGSWPVRAVASTPLGRSWPVAAASPRRLPAPAPDSPRSPPPSPAPVLRAPPRPGPERRPRPRPAPALRARSARLPARRDPDPNLARLEPTVSRRAPCAALALLASSEAPPLAPSLGSGGARYSVARAPRAGARPVASRPRGRASRRRRADIHTGGIWVKERGTRKGALGTDRGPCTRHTRGDGLPLAGVRGTRRAQQKHTRPPSLLPRAPSPPRGPTLDEGLGVGPAPPLGDLPGSAETSSTRGRGTIPGPAHHPALVGPGISSPETNPLPHGSREGMRPSRPSPAVGSYSHSRCPTLAPPGGGPVSVREGNRVRGERAGRVGPSRGLGG